MMGRFDRPELLAPSGATAGVGVIDDGTDRDRGQDTNPAEGR
jgi:hypothetical protein